MFLVLLESLSFFSILECLSYNSFFFLHEREEQDSANAWARVPCTHVIALYSAIFHVFLRMTMSCMFRGWQKPFRRRTLLVYCISIRIIDSFLQE